MIKLGNTKSTYTEEKRDFSFLLILQRFDTTVVVHYIYNEVWYYDILLIAIPH